MGLGLAFVTDHASLLLRFQTLQVRCVAVHAHEVRGQISSKWAKQSAMRVFFGQAVVFAKALITPKANLGAGGVSDIENHSVERRPAHVVVSSCSSRFDVR
jgi:hypothetical protein